MEKKRIFNLLHPIEQPKSSWDKIYGFISMNAKAVILIIEILIVIAFVSKIVVDNIAKNRLDEFNKVNDQLSFFEQNQEGEFRRIQFKDINYTVLWNNATNYTKIVEEVYGYVKNPSANISITLTGTTLKISGTNNLDDLKEIEAALKKSANFINPRIEISLDEKDIQQNSGQFDLFADIKSESIKREII